MYLGIVSALFALYPPYLPRSHPIVLCVSHLWIGLWIRIMPCLHYFLVFVFGFGHPWRCISEWKWFAEICISPFVGGAKDFCLSFALRANYRNDWGLLLDTIICVAFRLLWRIEFFSEVDYWWWQWLLIRYYDLRRERLLSELFVFTALIYLVSGAGD